MIALLFALMLGQASGTPAQAYLRNWQAQQDASRSPESLARQASDEVADAEAIQKASQPYRDPITPPVREALSAYRVCTERKARLLERSGERAEAVATAAISACGEAKQRVDAVYAPGDYMRADALYARLDPMLHSRAVQIVVEMRASKHSAAERR